jgi:hypothetical protein
MINRWLTMLLLCLMIKAAQANQQVFDRYTYWSLLTSHKIEDVHLAAQAIADEQISDTAILDVAAVVLWQQRFYHYDEWYIDALSTLASDLSLSGDRRYLSFLQRCQAEFSRNSVLSKAIATALQRIERSSGNSDFTPDEVDLNHIKQQLLTQRAASEELIAAYHDRHIDVRNGVTPLRQLLQKYGYPTLVEMSHSGKAESGAIDWDTHFLRIWYPDAGGFRLAYSETAGWHLIDRWPLLRAPLVYHGVDWGMAYALWTADVDRLMETYQQMYREKNSHPLLLDIVADRLWLSLQQASAETQPAMSWACKLLAQSKNGRYAPVLRDVANQSQHAELKNAASIALAQVDDARGEPYLLRDVGEAP